MLLPLFFFFLLLLHLHLSSSSISFPDFQIIDVLQPPLSLTGTLPDFNNTHFSNESNKYTLRLLHRDRFPSVSYRNHHHRLHARMHRDTDRVAAILRRIYGKTVTSSDSKYQIHDFGSDVVSGMDQGSGEYFVRIGVGSRPKDLLCLSHAPILPNLEWGATIRRLMKQETIDRNIQRFEIFKYSETIDRNLTFLEWECQLVQYSELGRKMLL